MNKMLGMSYLTETGLMRSSTGKAEGPDELAVATADKPTGPYGKRRLLIAGGGWATLFQNEKGEWLAACEQAGRLVIAEVKL